MIRFAPPNPSVNPGRARLRQAVPGQSGFARGLAEATFAWPLQGHDTTDPVDSASADRDLGLRWSPAERQIGCYDQTADSYQSERRFRSETNSWWVIGAKRRSGLRMDLRWRLSHHERLPRADGQTRRAAVCGAVPASPASTASLSVHQRAKSGAQDPSRFPTVSTAEHAGADLGATSRPVLNEIPGPHAGRGEPPRPRPLILQSARSTDEHREVGHLYRGVSRLGANTVGRLGHVAKS